MNNQITTNDKRKSVQILCDNEVILGMMLYEQFKNLNIDFDALELSQSESEGAHYFCTPVGAKVIGWAGVDGIHYCFVPGFGETVFAVNPMNGPGESVHAIARSFSDLLRLLLACGDMAALEQAWQWTETEFDEFLRDNPPSPETLAAFPVLREKLCLTPMEHPYAYLKDAWESVDYDAIPFPAEYYDDTALQRAERSADRWKVTFDGGFWGETGAAGEEIHIDADFLWNGEQWNVPSVYRCGEGFVIDLCRAVDRQTVEAFYAHWADYISNEYRLTTEQREQMQRENPMLMNFCLYATLNGKELRQSHESGSSWLPAAILPKGFSVGDESAAMLTHYGLDAARPWIFIRTSFRWPAGEPEPINSLRLTLQQEPVILPAEKFRVAAAGDAVALHHPLTGAEYRLKVLEYEPYKLDLSRMPVEGKEYPTHCFAMRYTLTPELPEGRLLIRDSAPGDSVRVSGQVGVIGGADGPTAFFLAAKPEKGCHAVFSSIHFHAPDCVEWRADFREKLLPDIDVVLK